MILNLHYFNLLNLKVLKKFSAEIASFSTKPKTDISYICYLLQPLLHLKQKTMYLLPTVIITYQGKPLSDKYFNEHPEIHLMYPTKEEFMNKLYLPVLQKVQETNTEQVLEISENSIKINGVSQNLS